MHAEENIKIFKGNTPFFAAFTLIVVGKAAICEIAAS